uniref:Putative secreted peptide n=1 Tax=Anopheles braziliensis TaxID=58242 RepID=A0A2M3ZR58_9DIPT
MIPIRGAVIAIQILLLTTVIRTGSSGHTSSCTCRTGQCTICAISGCTAVSAARESSLVASDFGRKLMDAGERGSEGGEIHLECWGGGLSFLLTAGQPALLRQTTCTISVGLRWKKGCLWVTGTTPQQTPALDNPRGRLLHTLRTSGSTATTFLRAYCDAFGDNSIMKDFITGAASGGLGRGSTTIHQAGDETHHENKRTSYVARESVKSRLRMKHTRRLSIRENYGKWELNSA